MEWSKIKNIILLILLTVNLFLLVLVVFRAERSARYLESARENAVGLLEKNGIAVNVEDLPEDTSLAPLSMERDQQQEEDIAAALLGDVQGNGKSGVVRYTGEKGTARFSRSGEFTVTLHPDAYPLGEQTVREHAVSVLALLDFQAEVLTVEEEDGQTVVTARQLWQGTPVFPCTVTLVYGEDALLSIREGSCRLTGTPATSGTAEQMSVVTALLHFLKGLGGLGDVCTSLTGITPGYTFSSGFSDPVVLRPVWYITTDTGAYYLDAETGALERVQ